MLNQSLEEGKALPLFVTAIRGRILSSSLASFSDSEPKIFNPIKVGQDLRHQQPDSLRLDWSLIEGVYPSFALFLRRSLRAIKILLEER